MVESVVQQCHAQSSTIGVEQVVEHWRSTSATTCASLYVTVYRARTYNVCTEVLDNSLRGTRQTG
jgi:hypothetical protein